jgi:AcrR family transcriptional regulator
VTTSRAPRKRRANGEESRQKILDAATEIAGERGYEGTSISLVSERSGLPASSIYWHFSDKDGLIAAVIERSFGQWLAGVSELDGLTGGRAPADALDSVMQQNAKALLQSGDFLRLGLMLALERRPEEPAARRMFLQVRDEAVRRVVHLYRALFADLDDAGIRQLATFTMAMADGLFIAREIDGDAVDMLEQFKILTAAILAVADNLRSAESRPKKRAR